MTIKEVNDQINRLKSFKMNIKERSEEEPDIILHLKEEFLQAVRFRNLKFLVGIVVFLICILSSLPTACISSGIILLSSQLVFVFQKNKIMESINLLEANHNIMNSIFEESDIQIDCLENVKSFKQGKALKEDQVYEINQNLFAVEMLHPDIDEINKKYETGFDIYKEYRDYLENSNQESFVISPEGIIEEKKEKVLTKVKK